MRKKILSACVGVMSVCMAAIPETEAYAAVMSESEVYEAAMPGQESGTYGLFTTKYRVCVSQTAMRSGPGTNYPSLGTLYRDDIVWVWSISDGWAKFKVNSKWHYIKASCIEKAD